MSRFSHCPICSKRGLYQRTSASRKCKYCGTLFIGNKKFLHNKTDSDLRRPRGRKQDEMSESLDRTVKLIDDYDYALLDNMPLDEAVEWIIKDAQKARAQAAQAEALEKAVSKAISDLILIGNDLNWPAWLPMEYANVINDLREIEHASAQEQGGEQAVSVFAAVDKLMQEHPELFSDDQEQGGEK